MAEQMQQQAPGAPEAQEAPQQPGGEQQIEALAMDIASKMDALGKAVAQMPLPEEVKAKLAQSTQLFKEALAGGQQAEGQQAAQAQPINQGEAGVPAP